MAEFGQVSISVKDKTSSEEMIHVCGKGLQASLESDDCKFEGTLFAKVPNVSKHRILPRIELVCKCGAESINSSNTGKFRANKEDQVLH